MDWLKAKWGWFLAAITSNRSKVHRRRFVRWLKESKPTEWIVAIATLLGILAVYLSGVIDQKRSELEQKKSELTVQTVELERTKKELSAGEIVLRKQLVDTQNELDRKNEEARAFAAQQTAISTLQKMNRRFTRHPEPGPYIECTLNFNRENPTILEGVRAHAYQAEKPLLESNDAFDCPEKAVVLECCAALPSVSDLSFANVRLTSKDILKISGMRQITLVYLDACGLNDSTWTGVGFREIRVLSLKKNRITTLPEVEDVSGLIILEVGDTSIGDVELVPFLKRSHMVRRYCFDRAPITDASLKAITSHSLNGVNNVSLNGTKVSFVAVKDFVQRNRVMNVYVDEGQFPEMDIRAFVDAHTSELTFIVDQVPSKDGGRTVKFIRNEKKN